MSNRNWGRLNGDGSLELAPEIFDGGIPTDADYAAHGYKAVVRTQPERRDGMVARPAGWRESGDSIVQAWEYSDASAQPRGAVRYSRKKFLIALAKRGVYEPFRLWAEETEILNGLAAWDLLTVSTYLKSDDPEFTALVGEARGKFGASAIDEVLAESEDEEW